MNKPAKVPAAGVATRLVKPDATSPALKLADDGSVVVKAGVVFNGTAFDHDTSVSFSSGHPIAGSDYAVVCDLGALSIIPMIGLTDSVIGGFHFAPGGIAIERKGGDEKPAINPSSIWDINFRPACADPRGMALVEMPGRRFWCDIHLLGVNHQEDGTSKLGAAIADGDEPPVNPATGKNFKKLDYEAAVSVMAHHGKALLSFGEFACAAYGVTEKSSAKGDPKVTKLDAARTSKFGIMQATGNLWVWGHDGDPDEPRASLFGGSWWSGDDAGSRYAVLGYWSGDSGDDLSARGRSDHLQLG